MTRQRALKRKSAVEIVDEQVCSFDGCETWMIEQTAMLLKMRKERRMSL
jgi:hypothetical protein